MEPDGRTEVAQTAAWQLAKDQLADAGEKLAAALPGIAGQAAYVRFLEAQRRCTAVVHTWLAEALYLERVVTPRLVLSLDVDGVLEEQSEGFSAAGLTGVAALRLLQLGGVAVLLNTGRSLQAVRDRVEQFALLGGVAAFGGAVWDGVFSRTFSLVSDRGVEQLTDLRERLRADGFVLDPSHSESIRASRLVDGPLVPIAGPEARALLDRHGFTDLTYWVAPTHTDFVDRRAEKSTGLTRLRTELSLNHLPLAAIGDGSCDVPTLRQADKAFVPAATLPSYVPTRRQHFVRSRYLCEEALWDAASRLVPDASLHRRVRSAAGGVIFPAWFPQSLRRPPPPTSGRFQLPSWRLT